jgi:hypothetical protein
MTQELVRVPDRDQLTQDLAICITLLDRSKFSDVAKRLAEFSGSLWDDHDVEASETVYFKRVGSSLEDSMTVPVGTAALHVDEKLITRIVPVPLVVDVNEVERCLRYFKAINETDIDNIVWKRGDKALPVDPVAIPEFRFIGLSNRDFPSVMGWMPDGIGIRVTTMTFSKKAAE